MTYRAKCTGRRSEAERKRRRKLRRRRGVWDQVIVTINGIVLDGVESISWPKS